MVDMRVSTAFRQNAMLDPDDIVALGFERDRRGIDAKDSRQEKHSAVDGKGGTRDRWQ